MQVCLHCHGRHAICPPPSPASSPFSRALSPSSQQYSYVAQVRRRPHCASSTAPCRLPPTCQCTLWRSATGANSQLNCDCFGRLLRLLRTATAERCRRPVLLRQQQQPLPLLARPLRGGPRCRPLAVAPRSVLLRCRCCRCPHRQLPPARPCKRTQVPFHAFGFSKVPASTNPNK